MWYITGALVNTSVNAMTQKSVFFLVRFFVHMNKNLVKKRGTSLVISFYSGVKGNTILNTMIYIRNS